MRSRFADSESVLSIGAQSLNLFLPLLLFRRVFLHGGADQLVEFEVLLAIFGFLSIGVELGTGFLVTGEDGYRREPRRYASAIVVMRFLNACAALLVLVGAALWDPARVKLYILSSLALLVVPFGAEYHFLSQGRMPRFQLILSVRMLTPLGLLSVGIGPLEGFVIGVALSNFIQMYTLHRTTEGDYFVDVSLIRSFYRRYSLAAVSDFATGLFTQLDSYFAGTLLIPKQAIVYITIRKLVRAALSLLNYSFRIVYLRFARDDAKAGAGVFWILTYTVTATIGFILLWEPLVRDVLGVPVDPRQVWQAVAWVMAGLFIVGVGKSLVLHLHILRFHRFSLYFVGTLASVSCLGLIGVSRGAWDAVSLSYLRVLADVVFLVFIGLSIWWSWFRSTRGGGGIRGETLA